MFLLSSLAKDFAFVSTEVQVNFLQKSTPSLLLEMTFLLQQHLVEIRLQLHIVRCFLDASGKDYAYQKTTDEWIPQIHLGPGLKILTFHY